MKLKTLAVIFLFGLLLACSTKRNTFVSRNYHNVTARFNGYYYSCENLNEGIYKIEKNNKDNFEKTLPVFIYPSLEKAKVTFPEFDKAIKKSSFCIQRHTIKDKKLNEIPSAGKWIDNNWINIGISQFYKKEYYTSLENFEYVARTYTKSQDKYVAMLWIAKVNNEIGAVSVSESILSLLRNEKKLPAYVKRELPLVEADYYMRQGLNTEAFTKLMAAVRNTNLVHGLSKKRRARYAFIVAQLLELNKDNKRAKKYYEKTIKLNTNYDLVFYSKIKLARMLDVKRNNSEKTKKDLLRMAKEFKNSDYYDVIYYTLGEIEEKENNKDLALKYYKKSVQTSVVNPSQKALSYLKIGELNFDKTNYQLAGTYYDSTVVTLPKDHPQYNLIVARKKTLENLVKQINTIKNEDSLQKVSRLSESQLNALIDKIIDNEEQEELKKQKEKELAEKALESGAGGVQSGLNQNPRDNQVPSANGALFYFYNPNTVAFGVADFQKKWGNRKYEDNWRRSNKSISVDDPNQQNQDVAQNNGPKSTRKSRDNYKKGLYTSDSLISKSNNRIIEAYYTMGSIYKEDLQNNKKAIATYEELNSRFPNNKYLLNNYYLLYRTHTIEKNNDNAETYKTKIINEFPESEFAALLKNPENIEKINSKKTEVEAFYIPVYKAYRKEKYDEAYAGAQEGIVKFGNNDFRPRFEFIKGICEGKIKSVDTMETTLKLLVARYPKADVTPAATDILQAIKRQKNPELFEPKPKNNNNAKDTFLIDFDKEHFIVAVLPDDPKIANSFKSNLDAFCTKYYPDKSFNITSNIFSVGKQIVLLKSFNGGLESNVFANNLLNDKDLFNGDAKREMVDLFPILNSNLTLLYKNKNTEGYKAFYIDNYKNLSNKPK
ncbi:MAG: tetratricopeptide repeat protein [Bacteroidetes bacterium]|nr:tetratricopeptide repeat protein [Bacteroidota bacterium]MCA6444050.1 tetratricopeptide repeat protein [Bacteroidota bacterium]